VDALTELAMALRGLAVRGLVVRVADGGQTQTVDVETHEGVVRSAVEVLQPFGLGSVPAGEGALAVLLALGGDQGDMVALPIAHPSVRFGALVPGETVLYDAAGNRLHFRDGSLCELKVGAKVLIETRRVEIEASAEGLRITGDVEIVGNLKVTGEVEDHAGTMQEMRDRYNAHGHPGAAAPPTPAMD
jgi:phage gp45-like